MKSINGNFVATTAAAAAAFLRCVKAFALIDHLTLANPISNRIQFKLKVYDTRTKYNTISMNIMSTV